VLFILIYHKQSGIEQGKPNNPKGLNKKIEKSHPQTGYRRKISNHVPPFSPSSFQISQSVWN
jgi:hypothetical protein